MNERLAPLLLTALAGCAAGARSRPPSATTPSSSSTTPSASTPRFDAAVPSLDVLATRHARELPLMRETLRVAQAAAKPADLESKTADTCFRAAFAANVPVRAWFEDAQHSERGESSTLADTAKSGLVPPRGPACARKGESLKLVIVRATPPSGEGAGAAVVARAIVWQSP